MGYSLQKKKLFKTQILPAHFFIEEGDWEFNKRNTGLEANWKKDDKIKKIKVTEK